MSNITPLKPVDGRKSFYGKAQVGRRENGTLVLISYGTEVAELVGDTIIRLWDGMTATTRRHVAAFLDFVGSDMTTREFAALPVAA